MPVKIVKEKMQREELTPLAQETFVDMVKAVVDVGRGILAVGGGMHADGEAALLADGSKQNDLWGINLYLEKPKEEWIEFESVINIRPALGNRSNQIQDSTLQEEIRKLVGRLIM